LKIISDEHIQLKVFLNGFADCVLLVRLAALIIVIFNTVKKYE